MKTLNKFLIPGLASILLLCGCEDFLDKSLQGKLTQDGFPTSKSDALLATNAVYSSTRAWSFNSGGYPILDIMTDDSRKGSNPNDQLSNLLPFDNFTFTTTAENLPGWWATLYEGIKRANVVIEKVQGITMDETLKNRYVAEARFLRGIFYFDLVRAWGEVPLVKYSLPWPGKKSWNNLNLRQRHWIMILHCLRRGCLRVVSTRNQVHPEEYCNR
jgi:hypothetical protein